MPKVVYIGKLSKHIRLRDLKDELKQWDIDRFDMRTGHAYVVIYLRS